MIEVQAGDTFAPVVDNAPAGITGTIGVKLTDLAGATVIARSTSGITEINPGEYVKASMTAPATAGDYLIVWDTGGGSPVYASENLTVRDVPANTRVATDTIPITDRRGNVLVGVSIHIYERGTTTPVPIYTTATGTTTAAQPLTTDDDGYVVIPGTKQAGWVDFGLYDVVAAGYWRHLNWDAGSPIFTSPGGAAGGDLAGTFPNPTLKRTTLAGVLDDTGSAVSGIVITPQSSKDDGIVVRRPSSAYGSPFDYGDAQAFMLIKEGTGNVHDDLVLARIDGRTGAGGFAGGLHSAGGLHKDAGDATPTQNLWVQNNLDMVGIVVNAFGTNPTASYQLWNDGSGNTKAAVTNKGVIAAYAADATFGSLYVGSPASTSGATIAMGTGGAAVDATIGVAGAANQYLPGVVAKDLVVRGGLNGGGVIVGAAGVINATFGGASGIFVGTQIAMNTNKIGGLGDPVAAQDAATKKYVDKLLGYAEATANATSTSTSTGNDAWTGLSITVTADGVRSIMLEAFCSVASNNTAGDGCQMSIYEGATQIATATMTAGTASKGTSLNPKRLIVPGSAGSRTFTVKVNAIGGGTATFSAAAPPGIATPAWLMARYI